MKHIVKPVINKEGKPSFSVFRKIFFIFWVRAEGAWDYGSKEYAQEIADHLNEAKP